MTSTSIRIETSTLNRLRNIKNGRSCDKVLNDLIDLHEGFMEDMTGFSQSDKDDLTVNLFEAN